jgi:hypothetical protein
MAASRNLAKVFSRGAKQRCICTTIGARVVPTRSSSIRGNRFIKTFQVTLAFAGAAAWDKPRSRYSVQLHPFSREKQNASGQAKMKV